MVMKVTVLREGYDRTNGGVSSQYDRLLVIRRGDRPPDRPSLPVMVLELHAAGEVSLRPLEGGPAGYVGPIAGGNYAAGGRDLADAVSKTLGRAFGGSVPIHDRYESQELADHLGR